MPRRMLFILLPTLFLLLVIVGVAGFAGLGWLREHNKEPVAQPQAITSCDLDASAVCVVSFGSDTRNQLVINLHLPDENYPPFYALLEYRGKSLQYRCQIVQELPSSAYCTGEQPPLGALVTLRLFAVENNGLLAEGKLAIRAIALPTFSKATATLPAGTETATPTLSGVLPNPTLGTSTRTSTPPSGYPGGYP